MFYGYRRPFGVHLCQLFYKPLPCVSTYGCKRPRHRVALALGKLLLLEDRLRNARRCGVEAVQRHMSAVRVVAHDHLTILASMDAMHVDPVIAHSPLVCFVEVPG